MKTQDRERARLVYPRAEGLLAALDAVLLAAGLMVLRPVLEVQASGHAPGLILDDPYALTWTPVRADVSARVPACGARLISASA